MMSKLRTFVSSGGIEIKNYEILSQVIFYLNIDINTFVVLVFEYIFSMLCLPPIVLPNYFQYVFQ